MPDESKSRFTSSNQPAQDQLTSTAHGVFALSDYRKRRAELLDQQGRDALLGASATPDRSQTGTPDTASDGGAAGPPLKKKKKKAKLAKLSFQDDDGEEEEEQEEKEKGGGQDGEAKEAKSTGKGRKSIAANASVGVVPRAATKAALRREAAEREALRREFVSMQDAVKAAEVAIPFVFYDGTNVPGGVVRVRKGDFVWLFLDKSRKVGAALKVGDKSNQRREWARISVDDLMLVRGSIIIPPHYDFYFFVLNKSRGPGGRLLFDFSSDAPAAGAVGKTSEAGDEADKPADVDALEGARDDPAQTKVVDRRWYERNKHIYPASVWQEFDPEKDYTSEIRKDTGGNTFFFSR